MTIHPLPSGGGFACDDRREEPAIGWWGAASIALIAPRTAQRTTSPNVRTGRCPVAAMKSNERRLFEKVSGLVSYLGVAVRG
jgi:hypothetical protein